MVDPRLMKELSQSRQNFIAIIILAAFGAVLAIGQAALLTEIIDQVFLQSKTLSQVTLYIVFLMAILILRSGQVWSTEFVAHRLASAMKYELRQRLVSKILQLGPVPLRQEQSGDMINALTEGIENLTDYFAKFVPGLVMAALIPLMMLLVTFHYDWLSALIMVITAPLIPIFMILIGKLAEQKNKAQWNTLSRLSAHLLDVLAGLTTLKIFNQSKKQLSILEQLSEEFRINTLSVLRIAFISALALELLATISTALIAVTIGLKLMYGHVEFWEAFFVLLIAPEFYQPLRQLGSHFHASMAGTTAADRIYEILGKPSSVEKVQQGGENFPQEWQTIEFDHVKAQYSTDRLALEDVSFVIKRGQTVALVGPSGSGKTTCLDLLLQLMVPVSGRITVGGQDLSALQETEWLKQMAYMPQMPHLFSGTVKENLRLAQSEASDEDMQKACKEANIHEFILTLPQGYDTFVGEGGFRLSGGQVKRLALARAFLKNAPILILDEATAGLDAEHEEAVAKSLAKLMQNRTVLMAAHRLGTIRNADCILYLQQGRIIEAGSHDELMGKNGAYANLVSAYQGGDVV